MLTWTPGTSGLLVRREVLDEVGGFDPGTHPIEDLDFTARVACRNKWLISVVEEVLFEYQVHDNNISSRVDEVYLTSLASFVAKHDGVLAGC
jgi:hypothetical protein